MRPTPLALVATALFWGPPGVGGPLAAENRLSVPPDALGVLRSDMTAATTLSSESHREGDRYRDCWIFGIEPGDDAIVVAQSEAFDPVIEILPGPVCSGRHALYLNDDAAPGTRNAQVAFNAGRNAWGVIITSYSPGGEGAYQLSFRQAIAGDNPDRIYTPSEPERLVHQLYDEEVVLDFSNPELVDRVFAPVTAEAMKALNVETGGLGLGFDFLVDGQDSDITPPEIRTRVWLDRSSLIDVRFENMGEPVYLMFHMRETPAGWRVEDIESRDPGDDQNWVLSQLLGLDLGVAAAREE